MSTLPLKGANKSVRQPLKHLTESQANRTMSSTPLNHVLHPASEESGLIQPEPRVLFSPPRAFTGGHDGPRLYSEFNGAGHPSFSPGTNPPPSHPHTNYYAYQQERDRFKSDNQGRSPALPRMHDPCRLSTHPAPSYHHDQYAFQQERAGHSMPPAYLGPTHHGSGAIPSFGHSYTSLKVSYPPGQSLSHEQAHFEQDRKRVKVDNEDQDESSPEAREPKNDDSRAAAVKTHDQRPCLLWLPDDKHHLTDLHCFVRKHCVFIFSATAEDVGTPRKGRKKALNLGQIGIGCLHCKSSKSKLKGSTYFPTSISGIYNATMIIQQRHFPVCPSVPMETYCEYNKLKGLTARSASTKEYWVSAAKKLGLVDTSKGVFFRPNEHPKSAPQRATKPKAHGEALVRLVEPEDKAFSTEYAYFVMEQMTTCVFTEADRLGKRKHHKIGFPGLACRHCYGGNGSGRFFPLTLKTFSDVSKSIHVLRNHLVKCTKAPSGMAKTVNMLYEKHKEEKQITPFGSQKIFFDQIWRRLHPELPLGNEAPLAKPPRAKVSKRQRGRTRPPRGNDSGITSQPFAQGAGTPLPPLESPPVIHRGRLISQTSQDDARHNKELCMIPKKRYLYSQSTSQSLPALPPRYPSPQMYQQRTSYTESDVSVAMILAGIGRNAKEEEPPKPRREEV